MKNRFIKAMEIGLAHEKEGISYFNLVTELHGTTEKVFDRGAEITFFTWFLENFDLGEYDRDEEAYLTKKAFFEHLIDNERGKTYHEKTRQPILFNLLESKWFLNGLAAKQYLDFQELHESRKAARRASVLAICSILIAIATILLSTFFELNAPEPPYGVKMAEPSQKVEEIEGRIDFIEGQLKRENDSLREELFKADLMLGIYEDGP